MIRKYLVCGKRQVFLQSKNSEAHADIGKVVELLLPINDFWKLENEIRKINYLTASDAPGVDVSGQLKKIFKASYNFAVIEADRQWIHERKK
ncbi:MAG: hypothetical protein V4655_00435 [Bdellovibrionota bacterium]|nr:MAG: hypothetical protein EOP10_27165 [Pseudomonadota bacterium]